MPNTAHRCLFFLLAMCTLLCSSHIVHRPSPALFVSVSRPLPLFWTQCNPHHMPFCILAVVSPPLLSSTSLITRPLASTAISTHCCAPSSTLKHCHICIGHHECHH
ncbi:hypothetical protein BD779DRAFT_1576293, partial [Infundibulicybe gibba]